MVKTTIFDATGSAGKSEKGLTLREYFELDRELKPGMLFCLINTPNDAGGHTSYEDFYIGDCTPYMEPSENDGGLGWDYDNPRMDKIINEIYMPHFTSRPNFD